jgi:hypothetical protein
MADRERVKKAIEAPVDAATKLLDEMPKGDVETRLAMLIDGWGRGLAAGLEELAISIGELRRAPASDKAGTPASPPRPAPPAEPDGKIETAGGDEARTEEELQAQAVRSRKETAALRDESSA